MEISNEIKAKVFAQYLGQMCQTKTRQTQGEGKTSKYLRGVLKEIDLGMQDSFIGLLLENETDWSNHTNYNSDQAKLILKPLTAITAEDAVEVAQIRGGENPLYIIASFRGQPEYKKPPDTRIIKWFIEQVNIYQYLQSKGYDLPMYLLDWKTLHESGLAIYENEI